MSEPTDPSDLETEIAQLRSERDRLRSERDALRAAGPSGHVPRDGHARRIATTVLTIGSILMLLVATLGFWAGRNLLHTDTWVSRVGPLAEDPAVRRAVAAEITDQVMQLVQPQELLREALPEQAAVLAAPLSAVVREFVGDQALAVVSSDRFAELWVTLNQRTHAAALDLLSGRPAGDLEVEGERVVLNLVPLIDQVLRSITQSAPGLLGLDARLPTLSVRDLPIDAREKLSAALGVDLTDGFGTIVVFDQGSFSSAQQALRLFAAAFYASSGLAIALGVAALVTSRRRRRTALQLVAGAAAVLVLIRRVAIGLQRDVVASISDVDAAEAVHSVLASFVDPVRASTASGLAILSLIAGALVLSGPYGWVRALRRRSTDLATGLVAVAVGDESADRTTTWMRDHATTLQVAGAVVAFAVVFWLDLPWLALLVVLGGMAVFELVVWRAQSADPHPQTLADAAPK